MFGAAATFLVAPAAQGATIKDKSPNLAAFRGKPVAVVFFHPL